MTPVEIQALIEVITETYLQEGWVTSRAGFPLPQSQLEQGILEIVVQEGRIEAIEITHGQSPPFNLFPGFIGQGLNLGELEQGLKPIHRLGSYRATLTIEPGQDPRSHRVLIHTEKSFPWQASVTLDNAGSVSTGEKRRTLGLAIDNLWGFYESWHLSHTEALRENTDQRRSRAWTAEARFPYGLWQLTYSASRSNFLTSQPLASADTFFTSGETETHTLTIERPVWEQPSFQVALQGSLSRSDTRSFHRVRDLSTPSAIGSRVMTSASIGLDITGQPSGGHFTLHPRCEQGIRLGGALDDRTSDFEQQAPFFRCTARASATRSLSGGPIPLTWQLTAHGQWTPHTLFGSQQFSLGGWGSVRGFKDTGLAGETGLAVQNTLQYTLNQPWTLKAPLILSAFVDIGAVHALATGSTDTLGGAGLALRYIHPWFTFHLTWANAWHRPESLAAEPPPLYTSLTFRSPR